MSDFYMPKVDLGDIVADIKRRMANNQTVTEDDLRRLTGSNEAQVIFPLEMFARLIEQNAALKEENERLSDGLSHHMNISQVLADGNANMYEMVMERDAEIELLKARVAELEGKIAHDKSSGLEAAANYIEQKLTDYDNDHGYTEPDTGARVYPGDGQDYVYQMAELADEIRALKEPANEG